MLGRFELGFALIDLEINNTKITAIIDTGFNGELLLPEQLIKRLNLKLFSKTDYVSIDGVGRDALLYSADLKLGDKSFSAEVVGSKSNFILIGMNILRDFRITLDGRKELVLVEE